MVKKALSVIGFLNVSGMFTCPPTHVVVSLLSSRSLTQQINYFRRGPDLVTEHVNTNKLLNALDALLNYKNEITSYFCIIHRQNVLPSY